LAIAWWRTQIERLPEDGKMYLKKVVDASQRMQTMIERPAVRFA
jgi:hypothetical protein